MKQLDITDDVERLLFDVVRPLYARDSDVPGLLDLPVAQLRALNVLGRGEVERTPTMGELADALGVALSTATQLVERIEKRGLAAVNTPTPTTGASSASPSRTRAAACWPSAAACAASVWPPRWANWHPCQQDALVAALAPLAAAIRQVDQDAARADAALSRLLQEVR